MPPRLSRIEPEDKTRKVLYARVVIYLAATKWDMAARLLDILFRKRARVQGAIHAPGSHLGLINDKASTSSSAYPVELRGHAFPALG